MSFQKRFITGILGASIIIGSFSAAFAQNVTYKAQGDDTFWTISQKFGVSVEALQKVNPSVSSNNIYPGLSITVPLGSNIQTVHTVQKGETYWTLHNKYGVDFSELLQLNHATETSWMNIGDQVLIPVKAPAAQFTLYTVVSGDTYWTVSQKYKVDFNELLKYNDANQSSNLAVGQKIKIPAGASAETPSPAPGGTAPYVTYDSYTVQRGDTFWTIASKFGLPMQELLQANQATESSWLSIGDVIKIPVHHIPVKSTPGAKYGELLDWWTEAQYVIPIGSDFEVVDFYTGKSFKVRRTTGSNHADCETLNASETAKMKEIWGGSFSWDRRPVLIKFNGRQIAASASAMPHAGNDAAPGGVYTTWRSGDYGPGDNMDWIKNNGMDGHFDIHFLNSTKHMDGEIDTGHQQNIQIAAGKK